VKEYYISHTVPLWEVRATVDGQRWVVVCPSPGGGVAMLNETFSTRGAAVVLAETLNSELRAIVRQMLEDRLGLNSR
jgi:hypothetical protein